MAAENVSLMSSRNHDAQPRSTAAKHVRGAPQQKASARSRFNHFCIIFGAVVAALLADAYMFSCDSKPYAGKEWLSAAIGQAVDYLCVAIVVAIAAYAVTAKLPLCNALSRRFDKASLVTHLQPVQKESEKKLTADIEALLRQSSHSKAGRLLSCYEANGLTAPAQAYDLLVRGSTRAGDVMASHDFLARMRSKGIEGSLSLYCSVLDCCLKSDKAELCEEWLQVMISESMDVNVIMYSMVISVWARRGDHARAAACFNRMIAAGITPDTACYSALIHAHSVIGDAPGTEAWLKDMESRGIEITVHTYSAAIDACAKSLNLQRAEFWMQRMEELGVEQNVISFTSLIDACAKTSDPQRAVFWHSKMVEKQIPANPHTYSAIVNAFAQVGDAAAAEEWLDKAEAFGCPNDLVIFSSVIGACAKANDAERAMRVYKRMREAGIKPHIVAYAALGRCLAYKGDYQQVELLAADMESNGVAVNEYFLYAQILSYACAKPRLSPARAEACLRKAVGDGVRLNDRVAGAFSRAVGRSRSDEVLTELSYFSAQAKYSRSAWPSR